MLCISVDEIEWVAAAGNYIEIHTGRKTHLVRHTVKEMEAKLNPDKFLRVRPSAIVNLAEVDYLNSSNIAQLLRLRKRLAAGGGRLRICSVGDQVWGVILVTGLDKLFEFHDDLALAIASLQLEA